MANNITQLLSMLKSPELWERTAEPFWDDEYISMQMLDAHLNPEWDAASRTKETIDKSVKWLSTIIPSGCKLLDLGCGPGLYTKQFSELGYDVTGLDFSKRSIAYAKEHDSKTSYIYQNYLEMEYENLFDAVTLIYCDYAALTADERKVLLANIHRALKPGGILIFDVFTPKKYKTPENSQSWYTCESGGFWTNKPHICLDSTTFYENNTVHADKSVIITEDGIKQYIVWDTLYTKESLTDEVEPAGFHVDSIYGDVCGNPYTDETETLCIVLSRK